MQYSILTGVVLLATLAAPAAAQERERHEEHDAAGTAALSSRTRELGRSVERLRQSIHETNRWMVVHGSQEGLHGVGTEMAHAGEHLQELVRRLDEAQSDPDLPGDPAARGKLDELTEQVWELDRQLNRTLGRLRAAVGYR